MRILITNDDGIRADGLLHFAHAARQFGEVKLVAPDRERSACAHGMTLREPLRVKKASIEDFEAYEVNGMPVDCVNVGLTIAYPDGCDLVLSGINNGPNLGFDVTYSGTVAGAMEGTINGIFSISLSMAIFVLDAPYHFETGTRWFSENLEMLLGLPRNPLTFLNINVPAIAYPELQGHKIVGMGQRVYQDRVERRLDPWGRPYYWQGGAVVMDVEQPGTDVHAVTNGFVAVSPISLDWTDHALLGRMGAAR
ncbi:MAG: 5'/3'-nucleotidase SurE [Armatimonadetes bacterium]|nr:5'/3'-nucleotidase SurE [Armatimonadota bacterium]